MNLNRLLDNDPIKTFLQKCQELVSSQKPDCVLSIIEGSKFYKIVESRNNGKSQSVFAFVDKASGDVLKAASFRSPAKHARGNINDDSNGMSRMTIYGPEYLK